MSEEKIDHIADLEKRLYARDPDSVPKRTFGILRPIKNKVASSWGEPNLPYDSIEKKHTKSGFKRLFFISFLFFILALGVAVFSYVKGGAVLSSKNVEMTILGNSFASGGEKLPIQIDITNKNSTELLDTKITISFPKGSPKENEESIFRDLIEVGTIPSGKTKTQSYEVVLYGEQGTVRNITASLEYRLAGSVTSFVKETVFPVTISSSPIALSVDAPSSIVSNQPFNINIRTVFTGDSLLDDAVVYLEYPNGYILDSSDPVVTNGASTWALGDMIKGTEKVISIRGRLLGEEQDEKAFHVYVGSKAGPDDPRIGVSYNSALHIVSIQEPFLSGSISVADKDTETIAIPTGSNINGKISFKNNSPLTITNPTFTLFIDGDIDVASIDAKNAFYDEINKSIVWNSSTGLNPTIFSGETGSLDFGFAPKSSREIKLALSLSGVLPERDFLESSISNIDQKILRFASRLQFASASLYSIGPIKNTGPFPPKVGQETSYTILWTIKPSENPLSSVSASATLPAGVMWTGSVYPSGELISYNPDTKVVSWNIGSMQKATSSAISKSAAFQVKVRPQKTDIGNSVDLLGITTINATDTVANSPISTTRPSVSTYLSTDPAYSVGKEKVLP